MYKEVGELRDDAEGTFDVSQSIFYPWEDWQRVDHVQNS